MTLMTVTVVMLLSCFVVNLFWTKSPSRNKYVDFKVYLELYVFAEIGTNIWKWIIGGWQFYRYILFDCSIVLILFYILGTV